MALPEYRPKEGDVVGFRFLWSWERDAGHDKPRKMRPCLIAGVQRADGKERVRLMPVSHRPMTKLPFLEVPTAYLREAGLDGMGCCVIPGEVNITDWPSGAWDRKMLPMGRVPHTFVRAIAEVTGAGIHKVREVDRDELAREIIDDYRSMDR